MSAVDNITHAWWKKASVRDWVPGTFGSADEHDYPLSALPPCELDDLDAFRREERALATALWAQYNWRTIQAEERLAIPAIDLLIASSSIDDSVKEGLLQTCVDEKFHTYFHTRAMWDAQKRMTRPVAFRDSTTIRELEAALAAEPERWKRNIIRIAYAVVAEVSVNAFLEVLSTSTEICAANRDLVHRHNKDEGYHSVIFVEAATNLLQREAETTVRYFREQIQVSKHSFLKHDVSMYERVFEAHAVACRFGTHSGLMTRDMSGVDRLLKRIES